MPFTSRNCYNGIPIFKKKEEPENTFLLSDFMIRKQVIEFCSRLPRRRRNYWYPEVGIEETAPTLDAVFAMALNDSLFVSHTHKRCLQDTFRRTTGQVPLAYPGVQDKIIKHHPLTSTV